LPDSALDTVAADTPSAAAIALRLVAGREDAMMVRKG
jgi:hypothetical protein